MQMITPEDKELVEQLKDAGLSTTDIKQGFRYRYRDKSVAKTRPIHFDRFDIRGVRNGKKSQFRRPMRTQRDWLRPQVDRDGVVHEYCDSQSTGVRCPFGAVGDLLWARETFAIARVYSDWETGEVFSVDTLDGVIPVSLPIGFRTFYAADDTDILSHPDDRFIPRYRPSSLMPRWAIRFQIRITGIRIERIQNISESDAASEGCDGDCPVGHVPTYDASPLAYHFSQVWCGRYGDGSWTRNPWVWVVDFWKES
jgi:hypothetical protein